jgi:transcriptional regulator with XRE-family HTH domain
MTRDKNCGSSLPGVVAGKVLRAARLSARVSEQSLARATGNSEDTIRAWEDGSASLAAVPLPDVEQLQAALREAGANPHVVADLFAAGWCDLVIGALADDEDTACLMADPVTREAAFGELMQWTISGHIPSRYQPYADPGPLLADPAVVERLTSRPWLG